VKRVTSNHGLRWHGGSVTAQMLRYDPNLIIGPQTVRADGRA